MVYEHLIENLLYSDGLSGDWKTLDCPLPLPICTPIHAYVFSHEFQVIPIHIVSNTSYSSLTSSREIVVESHDFFVSQYFLLVDKMGICVGNGVGEGTQKLRMLTQMCQNPES